MGYNHQLTDVDLKLPAGARLATIMNTKEVIQEQLDRRWEAERQAVPSQKTKLTGRALPHKTNRAQTL